eukprot:CAMPEP_0179016010 /NCGR_PEP_ID=MMETSP0796-20121207/3095_1 /TAXON_ID=73915 /ORGANISM="Pyrodinium bahamense, Strain pbaha01" /LENGTH=323 /DNA_ID=CAMNT_0020711679 /DNA_START=27 /DNA_END=995 /DNA_ORIENTATION=-
MSDEDGLLANAGGKTRLPPGVGFKVEFDGRLKDYASGVNNLLKEACDFGIPSIRLRVRGEMYKFDFEHMEMKNLNAVTNHRMVAPHNSERPGPDSMKDNLKKPLSVCMRTLRSSLKLQRPVYVVRVPEGSPGTTIRVPHPKKLGKALAVAVPREAIVGQPLFVPVPRTGMSELKYAAGGAAVAGAAAVASELATGCAIGGVGAGAAIGAPAVLGGFAIAGAVAASAAGVHYATRKPLKAAAVGALTIGALALADHVGDVGVVAAAGDVAEGAADLVEGVRSGIGDVADGIGDFADGVGDAEDAFVGAWDEAGDWLDAPGAFAV